MENLWVLLTAAETTKTLFFSFGPQMFTPAAVQYLKSKLPNATNRRHCDFGVALTRLGSPALHKL